MFQPQGDGLGFNITRDFRVRRNGTDSHESLAA